MPNTDTEVVIVGGGAAGIAAARRLREAAIECLVIEARPRLGGRAWTVTDPAGAALDLGCGWLHSADRNPWHKIAVEQGRSIDKTPPPWTRPSLPIGFSLSEQYEYFGAADEFHRRVSAAAKNGPDVPAAALLKPGCRWNGLIAAVNTYVSGAELDRISVRDMENYEDTDVNWRVVEGLGSTIAAHGADLAAVLDCPVRRIDHTGLRLRVETAKGVISASQAIITLPSALLAENEKFFAPALPAKMEAALGLPLGLADKLFLSLDGAEEFAKDSRLFGRTDTKATATYHLRPFGRPLIEVYFGGNLASELENNGASAFFDFAVAELVGLFGTAFARRLKPIHLHGWGLDPFSRGSYSYALPGKAHCREALASPVDGRLFFAGEACSRSDFSTAHGGFLSGLAAADQVIAARRI